MPTDISECSNCDCSSHQIIAAGGCPRRPQSEPACPPCTGDCNRGRACPARFDSEGDRSSPVNSGMRALVWAILLVMCAWCAAITFALALKE